VVERFSIANRNILSKFVELANLNSWPAYIPGYERLEKDNNFPRLHTPVDSDQHTEPVCYYQLEKSNGKWQIQFVDEHSAQILGVTDWKFTRKFEESMGFAVELLKHQKEKDQV